MTTTAAHDAPTGTGVRYAAVIFATLRPGDVYATPIGVQPPSDGVEGPADG